MKVLVTGGAGFIGGTLVESLRRDGHSVVVYDNFTTASRERVAQWTLGAELQLVEGDIRDEAALRGAIQGCEAAFHLAAIVSVPVTIQDPVGSHAVNVTGTLNLLQAAKAAGVRRVVMASSAAIYGESLQPHLEDETPAPISPYGEQKLALEGLGRKFHFEDGLETASLRFFNVYGPWQRADSPYSGVIAKFVERIGKGITPTIFGDGGQLRDFIYVGDVVAALRKAASVPAEQLGDGIFNVATGSSVSLLDLVEVICRITGKSLKPNFAPVRAGDIRVSLARVGKAEQALGFKAGVKLETGLRRLIDSVTI